MPGTGGFVGELLPLLAAYQVNTWLAIIGATGVILSAAYALWLYRRIIFGALVKPGLQTITDLSPREIFILVPLLAVTIFMGVYPKPIFDVTSASVAHLIQLHDAAIARGGSAMSPLANDLAVIQPELVMAIGGMALLMVGVMVGDHSQRLISAFAIIFMGVAGYFTILYEGTHLTAFHGVFVADDFTRFVKLLILGGAALVIIMSQGFIVRENMARFEFPVLIVFAVLGMMMMVSAGDFISLYMGLELQSLALYVLAVVSTATICAPPKRA